MARREADKNATAPQSQDHNGAQHVTPLSVLERARTNDPEAWRRLSQLYRPLVLFWCGKGGIRAQDAEDVAQEVFAAAAAGLGRFRRDRPGDSFRAWLRGITRNQILLSFRRNHGRPSAEGGSEAFRQMQSIPDPLPGPGEDEEAELKELYRRAVEQVRDRFEERTWQAFWMTVVQERIPATLTEELGMTVASIRQAKSRVLRMLKEELGDVLG